MKKSIAVKLLLSFSIFATIYTASQATTPQAEAYTTIGGKYGSSNITWNFQGSGSNYAGASTFGVNAWNNANTDVTLTHTNDVTKANIIFRHKDYGNIGWNARCANKPVHTSGTYTRSDIDFNEHTMEAMTISQRTGVSAHELGHAFGLDHVTDKTQVMCTWGNGRTATAPGSDDIKGVNALY
ncbi:matrixin family metalloprotease [Paenibacillus sp. PL2-23]|uniref:matrixin family metalloprotease n=1 Tax=Paenibacillus sp. PL2-23 TaxID=2100729 RepID=UPI0030F9D1B6